MVRYELLKKLQRHENWKELISSGIIPSQYVNYMEIYEAYVVEVDILVRGGLKQRKANRQANTNVASRFSMSESSLYLIVSKMTSE